MRLTAPQRALMEMDERMRGLERRSQNDPEARVQHYIALIRAGQIKINDLATAGVLGNYEARKAAESLGEEIPVIAEPNDILNMFGLTKKELLEIFEALYKGLRGVKRLSDREAEELNQHHPDGLGGVFMAPSEEAGWIVGRLRNNEAETSELSGPFWALRNIVAQVGMKKVLEIIQPVLIQNPALRGVTDR